MLSVEDIARICHEANRAYCMTLGDVSQPTWDMAPKWQKDSAVNGVESALLDPGKTAEGSHKSWMALKAKAGWKYGPVKRPEQKEHPCMVPYTELPQEQRIKDELFLAVVRVLASSAPPIYTPKPAAAPEPPPEPEEAATPPREDSTQEVGVLTDDGQVVKGMDIATTVVPKSKKK